MRAAVLNSYIVLSAATRVDPHGGAWYSNGYREKIGIFFEVINAP